MQIYTLWHHKLIPAGIDCEICRLRPVGYEDVGWVDDLLSIEEVVEELNEMPYEASDMVRANIDGEAMYMAIESADKEPVGVVAAIPLNDCDPSMPRWVIEIIMRPDFMRKGYATASLRTLSEYLKASFTLPRIEMDICARNVGAVRLAERSGFVKSSCRYAYVNRNRVYQGIRHKWYTMQSGRRALYFAKGMQYYRYKKYIDAVQMWYSCLDMPHDSSTPYCDALILANIGMAYSSMGWYAQARKVLERAEVLAEDPEYIEKELRWISHHDRLV